MERFPSPSVAFIVVNAGGKRLAILFIMRDRSALMIAVLMAVVIFALQVFVKQHLFSSANIETAGKLQRIFKAGDILPLSKFRDSKNDRKPAEQKIPTDHCPRKKINFPSVMLPLFHNMK